MFTLFHCGYAVTKTRSGQSAINNPDRSHLCRLSTRRFDSTVENILMAVRGFHAFSDQTVVGQFAERSGQCLPILPAKTKRHKKSSFAAVVEMRGIQQIVHNLLPLDQSLIRIRQFHNSPLKALSIREAISSSRRARLALGLNLNCTAQLKEFTEVSAMNSRGSRLPIVFSILWGECLHQPNNIFAGTMISRRSDNARINLGQVWQSIHPSKHR